jgi:hypothetical protein
MQLLPTTLGTKACTFGFGNRDPFKITMGKDSPPPTLYRSRSQFDYTPGAGKSIGQSYACYKKVHMPGLNTRSDEIPGPGNYDIKTTLGMNSRKFSMKSRVKAIDSATRDNPPPNTYNPTYSQNEESRFDKITFGFGSRPNVTGRINENPGPGTYKIHSVFEKFQQVPNAALLNTLERYRKHNRRKFAKPAIKKMLKNHNQSSSSSTKQLKIKHESDKEQKPLAVMNDGDNESEGKNDGQDRDERQSVSNDNISHE